MVIRTSTGARWIWALLAFGGGALVGWIDQTVTDVQTTVLLLMIVNFALTLPGPAPVAPVAVASVIGLAAPRAIQLHEFGIQYVIALLPALLAAGGGQLAGGLLDTAASRLDERVEDDRRRWPRRALSRRFLLAIALVGIALVGLPAVQQALQAHRASAWLAIVWQIITLLGWIATTPLVLDAARWRSAASRGALLAGVSPIDAAMHAVAVIGLAMLHSVAIVTITNALMIPIEPGWWELTARAFVVYLPLDALTYLAILVLGAASDVERQRRGAVQREQALRIEVLDARLSALRARLNPHFLFNALNSVAVLARAGKTEETGGVIEGLTALLRYVLDDRRSTVPLRDELGFARQYLEVQRTRFAGRLTYVIDADPSLAAAAVPQLLLQPIIENAVEHGIAQTIDGGAVRVTAARDGPWLSVVVENDGPGPRADNETNGIGLTNTRERLIGTFGDNATLTLAPRHDGGTRVIIRIPYREMSASHDGNPA
jgi:hypothetical protein